MNDDLTTLLHDTAQQVPTALHPAADLRRHAQQHQRVRRTSAAVLAVTLLAGAIGLGVNLGDGNNRAFVPPAEQPPLTAKSLLIGDEVQPPSGEGIHAWRIADSFEGNDKQPVTACQRGGLMDLEAQRYWHRTFASGEAGTRQLAAQFASDDEAARAFDAIREWFARCAGTKEPAQRWPEFSAAGGRVATFWAKFAVPDDGSERVELVGVGVYGTAVTVVVQTAIHAIEGGATLTLPTEGDVPMRSTMLFALLRLNGDRDVPTNVLPDSFTFAEEGDEFGESAVSSTFGSTFLGAAWRADTCNVNNPLTTSQQALRTGMRLEPFDFWNAERDYIARTAHLQVAVYEDEDTAQAEAAELREHVEACVRAVGGSRQELETASVGAIGVHLRFHPKYVEGFNEGAAATTVVQLGKAVFMASALASVAVDNRDENVLTASAADTVRQAVENNAARICDVVDCD